jgi:predicted transcriptional regulator
MEKKVKDIMVPIADYVKIDAEAPLCEALQHLKRYDEGKTTGAGGPGHKTLIVTDASGNIVGKLSLYDLIKGLVPEPAKEVSLSRKFSSLVSSRALEVADEVGEMQKRFAWLHSTFQDLVKNEAHKKIKDVMSPLHPLLEEEDPINKAIFIMFKEDIRQPMVTRAGEIVGVINLMTIFPELLHIAGDECFLPHNEGK